MSNGNINGHVNLEAGVFTWVLLMGVGGWIENKPL